MSQKKEGPESTENKPGVKIQDLSPKKDAKGGRAGADANKGELNRAMLSGSGGQANAGGGQANAGGGQANAGGNLD